MRARRRFQRQRNVFGVKDLLKFEKVQDMVQCEADGLQRPDVTDPADDLESVAAISRCRAGRGQQQALALIKADGLNSDSCTPGEFADLHKCPTLSWKPESRRAVR